MTQGWKSRIFKEFDERGEYVKNGVMQSIDPVSIQPG
jgi:hypothetical protein